MGARLVRLFLGPKFGPTIGNHFSPGFFWRPRPPSRHKSRHSRNLYSENHEAIHNISRAAVGVLILQAKG